MLENITITTDQLNNINNVLDEYGVCVVRGYITNEEADKHFEDMKNWMIGLNIGLTEDPKTWKMKNMPVGPRWGMYQSIVSNAPTFFDLREKVKPVFESIWGTSDLICTLDGASIFPYKADDGKRWPHIDQTIEGRISFQSQIVLTNTSASFMCTPKSHKLHDELLKNIRPKKKNWYKFRLTGVPIEDEVNFTDEDKDEININNHIPIVVSKGSVIIWDSRLIHSARRHGECVNDVLNRSQYRCVLYICMRPRDHYSKANLKSIKKAVVEGRTTNHWGNLFPVKEMHSVRNDSVLNLMNNLSSLSYFDKLSDEQKKLFM